MDGWTEGRLTYFLVQRHLIKTVELCGSKNFIPVPVSGFLEQKNLGSVRFRLFSKKKNSTNV